MEEIKITVFFC